MSSRQAVRQAGLAIRERLGFPAHSPETELAPGFDRLTTEMVFGSVWARPGLALEDRMLATLAALTSRQYLPQFRRYAGAALNIGHSPRAVQEVVIHCALYAGFPTALNSLALVNEVLAEKGFEVADVEMPEPDDLMEKGIEVMTALHGDRAGGSYASPDNTATGALYETAIAYAYGDIWTRPGLDRRQRLICALASFTSLGLVDQLVKFSQAARDNDLSEIEIIEVISQTGPYTGLPCALNGLTAVGKVFGEF